MIRFKNTHILITVVMILSATWLRAQVQVRQEMITDEKELKVRLIYAAGLIELKKTDEQSLWKLKYENKQKDLQPVIRYSKSGTTGYLTLELESDKSMDLFDMGDMKWSLELTSALPVYFQAEFGACKGRLDLTDIRLKDCQLTLGASTMNVSFDSPNRERIRRLKIDAGLSKLKMYGLQNANFDDLVFDGGVGTYMLNFEGIAHQRSSVDINIGLGQLVMEIPEASNVRLNIDKSFMTTLSVDRDLFNLSNGDTYQTKNPAKGLPEMGIDIKAGIGKISVVKIP